MGIKTYAAMLAVAGETLLAGWSVILDATFLHIQSRAQVRSLSARYQIPLTFIWLNLPEATLRARILARDKNKTDISDADLAVLKKQLSHYQRPVETDLLFLNSSDNWPEL